MKRKERKFIDDVLDHGMDPNTENNDNKFVQKFKIDWLKELQEVIDSSKKKKPTKSSKPKKSSDDVKAIPDILHSVDIKLPNDNILRLNYLSSKEKKSSTSNQKEEHRFDLDTDFPELPGSSASSFTLSKKRMG